MKRILLFALVAGICSAQTKDAHDKQPEIWFTGLSFERLNDLTMETSFDMFGDGLKLVKLQNADMKCDADGCTSSPVTCRLTKDSFECSGPTSMGFEMDLSLHSDTANWKPLGISLGVESIGLFVSHKMVAYIDHREALWMLYGTDQRLLSRWDDLDAAKAEAERLFGEPQSLVCHIGQDCSTVAPSSPFGITLTPSCCNAGPFLRIPADSVPLGTVHTLEGTSPFTVEPTNGTPRLSPGYRGTLH